MRFGLKLRDRPCPFWEVRTLRPPVRTGPHTRPLSTLKATACAAALRGVPRLKGTSFVVPHVPAVDARVQPQPLVGWADSRGFGAVPMSHITNEPEHWRKRAQEMRIIANEMSGLLRAKDTLLRIAEQYELKAQQAEGRLNGREFVKPENDGNPHAVGPDTLQPSPPFPPLNHRVVGRFQHRLGSRLLERGTWLP